MRAGGRTTSILQGPGLWIIPQGTFTSCDEHRERHKGHTAHFDLGPPPTNRIRSLLVKTSKLGGLVSEVTMTVMKHVLFKLV